MADLVGTLSSSRRAHRVIQTRALRWATRRGALYILVLVLSAMFLFPFFWTIASSLKQPYEMFNFPPTILPAIPQWANYQRVLTVIPFGRWLMNTLVVVLLTTAGTALSSALVGFSFARFKYRGKDTLFLITLSTMMLPAQVTLIPQFIIFYKLGWIDTIKPLWVPHWFGGGAFYIFLMRQFIMSLPKELDEAALIDGASRFRVFWSIILPLCKPALATVAIIAVMGSWSDFLGPIIYLNTKEKFTLAVGLQYFREVPGTTTEPLHHVLMAACVLTTTPVLVFFFVFQRYFVRGVVMSGIKG